MYFPEKKSIKPPCIEDSQHKNGSHLIHRHWWRSCRSWHSPQLSAAANLPADSEPVARARPLRRPQRWPPGGRTGPGTVSEDVGKILTSSGLENQVGWMVQKAASKTIIESSTWSGCENDKMNESWGVCPWNGNWAEKKRLAFQPLDFACSIHGPLKKNPGVL